MWKCRVVLILTREAHTTGADVSAGHVLAGASIHTRVGLTLVVVDVAVLAAPARITQTVIADGEETGKYQLLINLFR